MHIPTRDTVRLHKTGMRSKWPKHSRSSGNRLAPPRGSRRCSRDITARKQAERELRRLLVDGQRRERWLGSISEVRLSMLAGGGLAQWLTLIARRASELSDADGITVSVDVRHDHSQLEVIATHGALVTPWRGKTLSVADSAAGRVFTSGRSVVTTEPAVGARW